MNQKALLLSLIVTCCFGVDLNLYSPVTSGATYFFRNAFSMKAFDFVLVILSIALYCLFSQIEISVSDRKEPAAAVLAALFSFFLLVGYSYESTGTMSLVYGFSNGQSLKALFYMAGRFILIYYLLKYAFKRFDSIRTSSVFETDSREHFLTRKTFWKVFLILSVAYLPYTVASYPAVFMYDECLQFPQLYPELGIVDIEYFRGNLLNDSVLLTQHFPVAQTLLITGFLKLGVALFHSANLGLFLYCLLQMAFLFSAVSYLVTIIQKEYRPSKYLLYCIIAYYIVSPRIHNYMMVTTKDVLYAGFLLYFLTFLLQLLRGDLSKKLYAGIAFSAAGLYLNRNDARYLLILFFICLIILFGKKHLKLSLAMIASVVFVTIILSSVVFPHFEITPASRSEMLSIPLQQTARYVKEYGNEVTKEEKESISRVLDYDVIAEKYDPGRSDYVKNTFKYNATKEDMRSYFSTWYQMFKKHPLVYVSATIHNYYQYVYPSNTIMRARTYEFSQTCFDYINGKLGVAGVHFHYPDALKQYRTHYQAAVFTIEKLFPLSILTNAASFSWLLLILLIYAISRKEKRGIAALAYPFLVFLLLFVSPCNGYFCRYTYPLILVTPVLFFSILPFRHFDKDLSHESNRF